MKPIETGLASASPLLTNAVTQIMKSPPPFAATSREEKWTGKVSVVTKKKRRGLLLGLLRFWSGAVLLPNVQNVAKWYSARLRCCCPMSKMLDRRLFVLMGLIESKMIHLVKAQLTPSSYGPPAHRIQLPAYRQSPRRSGWTICNWCAVYAYLDCSLVKHNWIGFLFFKTIGNNLNQLCYHLQLHKCKERIHWVIHL